MLAKMLAALLALTIGAITTSVAALDKDRRAAVAPAHEANWVLLGTRSLDLRNEEDRFEVGAGHGSFKSLRLVALDRRVDITRITIKTDGEPYIESGRLRLEHGERSHPITFSHEGGVVERVDLSYRLHLGAAGPAKVELWGLRTSPEVPSAHSASPHLVWIGTRSVDLNKEEDRIEVGASKGRFKSLVLVGLDRVIDINRVTVITDGAPHVDNRRLKLQRGHRSRPIVLGREGQPVKHVELSYRLHLGAAGPANVELWGWRVSPPPPVAHSEPSSPMPTAAAKSVAPSVEGPEGPGAVLFGVQELGSDTDHDVFKLGRQYGRFARLRLRALGGTVPLTEVRVLYAGGEPDVVALNAELAAEQNSAWLDLDGDRFIREIHFVYPSPTSRGKVRLEVYGEYAESWFQPGSGEGAFSTANDGWLYLGGQSPLFVSIRRGLGYETDTVAVARNRGFSRMRLDVKNRAITLNHIKVIYADGSSDVFGDRQRVAQGSSFGPVELKAERAVKEIEISHRSRIFDSAAQGSGYAFVEFWAK